MKKFATKVLTSRAARNVSALNVLAASLVVAGAPWDSV